MSTLVWLFFVIRRPFFLIVCFERNSNESYHLLKDNMRRLRALITDAAGELNVLGHYGNTLGVDVPI